MSILSRTYISSGNLLKNDLNLSFNTKTQALNPLMNPDFLIILISISEVSLSFSRDILPYAAAAMILFSFSTLILIPSRYSLKDCSEVLINFRFLSKTKICPLKIQFSVCARMIASKMLLKGLNNNLGLKILVKSLLNPILF
jgi:hypothetical protein